MTLEEQWQEDVKQFGELAYLMWEAGIKTHHDKTSYLSFLNNFSVELLINAKSDIRRKQSAALDFDLVAAGGGDEFYFTHDDGFKELIPINELHLFVNRFHLLKMKHPRRVGVDYSQFED